MRSLYAAWCLAVVLLLGGAAWTGWGLLHRREARGVPPPARDNPGAYRSSYSGGGRYLPGK